MYDILVNANINNNNVNDDVLILLIAHFPEIWDVVTKNATKKRLDVRKHHNMCTAVPAREGTLLTTCCVPSRITCIEMLTGTYISMAYITYTRKRGPRRANKKIEQNKNKTKTNMRTGRLAGRVPWGQGCCLLVRSILRV